MEQFVRIRPRALLTFLMLVFGPELCMAAQQCVILLHGLSRSASSMSSMATYLKKSNSNYIVINQSYPTTRKSINALANENVPSMVKQCQQHKPVKIHFVTHSMGGIVLRAYLHNHQPSKLGRIVMLAPPNHGSQLADLFHRNWFFKQIVGSAGQELTTYKSSTPNTLNQPLAYPVGIIAGNFSFNPFTKIIFHEDNDGKVAVSSTRINGMKDFIVLPVSHTFMAQNKLVMQEVAYFLQNGVFSKQA